MTRTGIVALIALILASGPALADTPPGKLVGVEPFEIPPWFKQSFLDIADDVDEATAAGRHVILFFHLEDCPYCARMIEDNFVRSEYSAFIRANFDVIDIDVRGNREVYFDEHTILSEQDLARHIGVRGTPTLLFLDDNNQVVLRLNGYRSVDTFEQIVYYVAARAYHTTSLSDWQEQHQAPVYTLRDHPAFTTLTDLFQVDDQPLAVLFEDVTCDACDDFYERILEHEDTRALLENFTVVRLDAHSDTAIIDAGGRATTPREYARALAIDYRPGLVLFDQGREIIRVDSRLRRFHLQQRLRYVAEGHHRESVSYRAFSRADRARLLSQGEVIDLRE